VEHELSNGRDAWLQVAAGSVKVNDNALKQGDGAGIRQESKITITAEEPAEILLFDLG